MRVVHCGHAGLSQNVLVYVTIQLLCCRRNSGLRVNGRLYQEVTALDVPAPAAEAPAETGSRMAPQEAIVGMTTAAGGTLVPPATTVLAAVAMTEAVGITGVVADRNTVAVAAGITAAVVADTTAEVVNATTGGIVATGVNVTTVSRGAGTIMIQQHTEGEGTTAGTTVRDVTALAMGATSGRLVAGAAATSQWPGMNELPRVAGGCGGKTTGPRCGVRAEMTAGMTCSSGGGTRRTGTRCATLLNGGGETCGRTQPVAPQLCEMTLAGMQTVWRGLEVTIWATATLQTCGGGGMAETLRIGSSGAGQQKMYLCRIGGSGSRGRTMQMTTGAW